MTFKSLLTIPKQSLIYFFFIDLPIGNISYEKNHTVCVLLCLPLSPEHTDKDHRCHIIE